MTVASRITGIRDIITASTVGKMSINGGIEEHTWMGDHG